MPKRKRDGPEDIPNNQPINAKGGRTTKSSGVEEKIHHGKKLLHRALKVAKGFERQKLGKRHKAAQQKSSAADISRIDAEILALKNLDLNVAAETHLYKTLQKEKAVVNSPLLPEHVKAASKPGLDGPTANVTARLYNSHPVKDALTEALAAIRRALGLEAGPKTSNGGRLSKEAASQKLLSAIKNGKLEQDGDSSSDNQDEGGRKVTSITKNELLEQDEDPLEATRDKRHASLDDDEDEDFAMLDDRIASGSDDDEEAESELEDTAAQSQRRYNPEVDLSLSPSHSASPSPPPIAKTGKSRKEPVPPSSTTYLPSLTMGGYYSGSESGSEPEVDIEQLTTRKNRRGQRARQKIWEQKFGGRAKHLSQNTQAKPRNARDAGWDMKRGAQLEGSRQEKKGFQPRWNRDRSHGGQKWTGSNAVKIGSARNKVTRPNEQPEKPLHPSWEAAKKAKEQRQTVKPEGKKLVFD